MRSQLTWNLREIFTFPFVCVESKAYTNILIYYLTFQSWPAQLNCSSIMLTNSVAVKYLECPNVVHYEKSSRSQLHKHGASFPHPYPPLSQVVHLQDSFNAKKFPPPYNLLEKFQLITWWWQTFPLVFRYASTSSYSPVNKHSDPMNGSARWNWTTEIAFLTLRAGTEKFKRPLKLLLQTSRFYLYF